MVKRILQISTMQKSNVKFMKNMLVNDSIIICLTLLWVHLCVSGNVHPNPRPSCSSSLDSSINSSRDSLSFLNTLNVSNHLSFMHYNVQSIINKIDILDAELNISPDLTL